MTTTTNPTPTQLASWRALAEAATEGPWGHDEEVTDSLVYAAGGAGERVADCEDEDDGRFIAAAREAVPALCAALEASREACAKLRARRRRGGG